MKKQNLLLILFVCLPVVFVYAQKKAGMLEYLANTTVKIQTVDSIAGQGNNAVSYGGDGTGFFFLFQTAQGNVPAIVTTKRMVEKAITISFVFLEADKNGMPLYDKQQLVTVKKTELPILYHPEKNVDLAVIPINSLLEYFSSKKININYRTLDDSVIPTDSVMQTLTAFEDLYILGHPSAISAELAGKPLLRKGVTGTALYLDYDHQKEFLGSIPVYDGDAGAPLLIYESNFSNRYDAPRTGKDRIFLVGIHYASYTKNFGEKIIPRSTHIIPGKADAAVVYENISIGIKAQKLFDFKKLLSELKK
jgi:hypothetical protein